MHVKYLADWKYLTNVISLLHPVSSLFLGYYNHLRATKYKPYSLLPGPVLYQLMNWSPDFLYCDPAIIKPIVRLNEIMFEGQSAQTLAYGKCLINDSSYNDGDDKDKEGIVKDYR